MRIPYFMVAGFALFAMLFGASNVMFPIGLGSTIVENITFASMGFFLTGVVVPFTGVIGIIMFQGKESDYYSTLNQHTLKILLVLMVLLIGPLGATPRCAIVAHGIFQLFLEDCPLFIFSACYCLVMFVIIHYTKSAIDIIGRILTPILITTIIIIFISAVIHDPETSLVIPKYIPKGDAFFIGLTKGYETMDLLATTFFGATIYAYITSHLTTMSPEKVTREAMKSCGIAALTHTLIYFSLIYVGNKFYPIVENVSPEQRMPTIGTYLLGADFFKPIVSCLVTLACLTTSTALVIIFTDFFKDLYVKCYITNKSVQTFITITFVFITSLVGFDMITSLIVQALSIMYPAVVALAIGRICDKVFNLKVEISSKVFYAVSIIAFINYLIRSTNIL